MPHKQKATAEQKLKVVRNYLGGKIAVSEAAHLLNVSKSTICAWVSHYKTEGDSFFQPHERNRVYTAELKKQAVQSYLNS